MNSNPSERQLVDPYLIITSDSHAGLPTAAYRPYLESKYHAAFDQFLSERGIALEEMTNLGVRNSDFADSWYAEHGEALNAGWDALKRDQELDAEGIAGEIIFPDADAVESRTCAPFGTGLGLSGDTDPELGMAGARAHNRWLAELCQHAPNGAAGLRSSPSPPSSTTCSPRSGAARTTASAR